MINTSHRLSTLRYCQSTVMAVTDKFTVFRIMPFLSPGSSVRLQMPSMRGFMPVVAIGAPEPAEASSAGIAVRGGVGQFTAGRFESNRISDRRRKFRVHDIEGIYTGIKKMQANNAQGISLGHDWASRVISSTSGVMPVSLRSANRVGSTLFSGSFFFSLLF